MGSQRWLGGLFLFLFLLVFGACGKEADPTPATSAGEGLERLKVALSSNDAGAIYPLLSEQTHARIEAVRQAHARALRLIDSAYPDEIRDSEKATFIEADTAEAFFASYSKRLHSLEPFKQSLPFLTTDHFVAESDGTVGFTGMDADWEAIELRAEHALKVARENADALAHVPQ